MSRIKGSSKTGGRKKGVPNVVTAELRERIKKLLESKWEDMQKTIDEIKDPKDRMNVYINLAKFVIPSLQSVSVDATVKKEDSVEKDLKELAEEE